MTTLSAAVIGAGSQGRVHGLGYVAAPGVRLVALADVNQAAGEALAGELGVPRTYQDYHKLLEADQPDIVSVCTPPAFHREVVRAAVAAGVRAIHCEEPIALSYGDALKMAVPAADAGVQLTFNLQRRFEAVQRFAREQIEAGEIGDVVTIEGYCPNLPDWGAHILDLIPFHRGDAAPSWVMGQIDVTVDRYIYGALAETASLTQIAWPDGVRAVVSTGREPHTPVLNLENNLGLLIQGTRSRTDLCGARCLVRRFGKEDLVLESPFDTDSANWDRASTRRSSRAPARPSATWPMPCGSAALPSSTPHTGCAAPNSFSRPTRAAGPGAGSHCRWTGSTTPCSAGARKATGARSAKHTAPTESSPRDAKTGEALPARRPYPHRTPRCRRRRRFQGATGLITIHPSNVLAPASGRPDDPDRLLRASAGEGN
jgi:hypothetical protein